MWNNYGRVFSEYIFNLVGELVSNIKIEGQEMLMKLKQTNQWFLFVILVILS